MLTVHTQIEEEIFYPACMEAEIKEGEDLIAEAKVEHQSAKDLIAKIEDGEPGGPEYDAWVIVLGEYIKHHVKEEHGEIFPEVRKSDLDLKDLGMRLMERKQELMGEGPRSGRGRRCSIRRVVCTLRGYSTRAARSSSSARTSAAITHSTSSSAMRSCRAACRSRASASS